MGTVVSFSCVGFVPDNRREPALNRPILFKPVCYYITE